MKDFTLEELIPLYARARQKVRNQRNELRALNKSINLEHLHRRVLHNEVERFRRLWDDERKRKMSVPVKAQTSWVSLPFLIVFFILGFILGRVF